MAYGARLESVLGASPRGFESPILRHCASLDFQVSNAPRAALFSYGVLLDVLRVLKAFF